MKTEFELLQDLDDKFQNRLRVTKIRILNMLNEVEVPMNRSKIIKDCLIDPHMFDRAISELLDENKVKVVEVQNSRIKIWYTTTSNFEEDETLGALQIFLYEKAKNKGSRILDKHVKFIIENVQLKPRDLTEKFNQKFFTELDCPIDTPRITMLKYVLRKGTFHKKIITRQEFENLDGKVPTYQI